ncbi:MAG TPA: phosphotransferase, partial [Ktedonobacterales bacterium]|nr:phosphotransferase [Ktedonobacterales bacterium]
MHLAALEQTWDLPGPWRISELAQGTNNLVRRVEAPTGQYVLRIYSNHTDPGRLRFEHTVLNALRADGLPFAVPAPLPTCTGELFTRITSEEGEALATLTPLIPGQYPDRANLEQATAAGETLALLDNALAQMALPDPDASVSWRSYGDLAHCHPLVPDPPAEIRELPLAEDASQRLLKSYDGLMARIPEVYASLPQQLAHEDYGPDNILMEGQRVTGVLDFEFCARDLRVMDLTVALSWWPVAQFGTGGEWPIIRAFVHGYARRLTLTEAE